MGNGLKGLFIAIFGIIMLTLSGCGGGGNSAVNTTTAASTASKADGIYSGIASANETIHFILLKNGAFYGIYSEPSNASVIAGVVQGNATVNSGKLFSSNAKDFNFEGLGVTSGTMTGTYIPKQSVDGSISYNNGDISKFSAAYDSTYKNAPLLSNVTGRFIGEDVISSQAISESATLNISASGSITSNSNGCNVTGSIIPMSNDDAYKVAVHFGGSPCYFANQTLSGIGYYDFKTKQLLSFTPNSTRDDGIIFLGIKQ